MGRSRLALGTVQFGLDYGVTNTAGRVAEDEVAAILALAEAGGIDTLDTATAYGDSEVVLGRLAPRSFRIITKIGGPPNRFTDEVHASAARLGRVPDAVLLHDARALAREGAGEVAAALDALRVRGLVAKVGLSVYTPEALAAAHALFRPDLVQLPFNLFDRRFVATGWLSRLRAEGAEVHARSLFLQGALLAPATPPRLAFADARFAAFRSACREAGITSLAACLAAGLAEGFDRLVIGVTSAAELAAILAAAADPPSLPPAFQAVATDDPAVVDPSRWPPA
ncbi:MAG: aldo/keto reductase [Acetobacteraceae bacterium]|jgi:hypothetical protein|nr:aldo/keto reductase [Acetobacteraceae bacterium]